ncbi:MAG: hypothetical protein JSW06_02470 [Thermoplasmatales archaeon]|nr:MAG: hypothetical protein JSW06_02470 [Thermoplasmatales archaeon]
MNKQLLILITPFLLLAIVLIGCTTPTDDNNSYQTSIILDDDLFQNASRDPYKINNIGLERDILEINVSFSGGCEEHEFSLFEDSSFKESLSVQIEAVLSHNDNDDPCDGIYTEELTFDLSPLKEKWQKAYQKNSGTIIIWLEGVEESLSYEF